MSRQTTTQALLSLFGMTGGIDHMRSGVFTVAGILVLCDTKNIQVLCWTFGHLIFLNLPYVDKILAGNRCKDLTQYCTISGSHLAQMLSACER